MNDVNVLDYIGHSPYMVGVRMGSHEIVYSIVAKVFYVCGDFGTAARISGVDKHCFIVWQFDKLAVALPNVDIVRRQLPGAWLFLPPTLFVLAVPLTALFLLMTCAVMSSLMFL